MTLHTTEADAASVVRLPRGLSGTWTLHGAQGTLHGAQGTLTITGTPTMAGTSTYEATASYARRGTAVASTSGTVVVWSAPTVTLPRNITTAYVALRIPTPSEANAGEYRG